MASHGSGGDSDSYSDGPEESGYRDAFVSEVFTVDANPGEGGRSTPATATTTHGAPTEAPATPAEDKAKVLTGTAVTRQLRMQVIKEEPRLISKACPSPSHKVVKGPDFKHEGTVGVTIHKDKGMDYSIKDMVDLKALVGGNLLQASVNTKKRHLGRQGNRLGGPTGNRECTLHKPLSNPAACRSRRNSPSRWVNLR
ncbi:hypothetical protein PR003_g9995 [Phytophthora rubi]|uniref:Uncharacterized protein n=1 Tax=Phytophthora rubi TaxID=129364 RepID=A0A6A4FER5_9STRA|nr:hypothetical protein PR001_g17732 [Phytophthora rubi]KAE9341429.1 hypothetical protein PR003_g9995 [Phytophthora rubi]